MLQTPALDAALSFCFILILILYAIPVGIVFNKAQKPGWASIIPIYKYWVILEMGGQKGKNILLAFIFPLGTVVALIYIIKAYMEIAIRFGKSKLFGILMIFFTPICFTILALSSAKYKFPKKQIKKL